MNKNNPTQSGVALLMSLGILALLSILGVAFSTNMRLMERTTMDFVYNMQTRYLAEAGIEYTIAQLKYGTEGARSNAIDTTSEAWYANGYSDNTLLSGRGSYSVKIIDCASQIYLNDGNPNLEQILKNLRTALGASLTDADCNKIANSAPYLTKEDVKRSGITDTKYNEIKDYITVNAYVGPYVVNPRDIDDKPYESQPRAPINVNTASQEVLQAVLTGLKAVHSCPNCGGDGKEYRSSAGPPDQSITCTDCDGTGTLEITSDEAINLADFIVNDATNKRPYKSWSEFYSKIKNCSSIGSKDTDLVIANANPNTGFSWARNVGWASKLGYVGKYVIDYNKDGNITDSADKGLVNSTTEFSFNSGGYYEVQSTGTLRNPLGNVVAQKNIGTVVKIFDIFRQTTQAQFKDGSKTNVQTYPEPVEATESTVSPASYDGQIMLAKKTSASSDNVTFRADYKTTLNADSAVGSTSRMSTAGSPTVGSVASTNSRGELMPDGMLVDNFDSVRPLYWPSGNISGDGSLEIWFKSMWRGYDTRIFGDDTTFRAERKLFRLTSSEKVEDLGYPYLFFYIWSAVETGSLGTWGSGKRGGGVWKTDGGGHWDYADGFFCWSSWQYGTWDTGTWNHLVVTWENTTENGGKGDPLGNYTKRHYIYFNGFQLPESNPLKYKYYYHTVYNDSGADFGMMIGGEKDSWNNNYGEFSDSILSRVRIWNIALQSSQIQAAYNDGLYESSGTFTSSGFNPGENVEWGTITWTEGLPKTNNYYGNNYIGSTNIYGINGDIQIDVDTGSGMTGNWNNPESDNTISDSGNSISYKATFSASPTIVNKPLVDTPVLEDVTITYLPKTKIRYWRGI